MGDLPRISCRGDSYLLLSFLLLACNAGSQTSQSTELKPVLLKTKFRTKYSDKKFCKVIFNHCFGAVKQIIHVFGHLWLEVDDRTRNCVIRPVVLEIFPFPDFILTVI